MGTTTPVALHVHRWGLGGARRALLVHGLAGAGPTWWRLAQALAADGFEVVAPDLRGHGASPLAERYRFADVAADLAPLGASWDLVVGHSLGGPVVAALLASGVRAGRTVLLDPVFDIPDDAFDAVAADQATEADPFADPAAFLAANPSWHPLDAHTKAAAARAVARFTVEQVMRDNAPWHAADLVDGVRTPLVILGGDPAVFTMCPAELGERLAARTGGRFEAVAGAGHGVHRDRPDAVLAACRG
jgi:pimeloyl-ACP methyl ester carboxylesterase